MITIVDAQWMGFLRRFLDKGFTPHDARRAWDIAQFWDDMTPEEMADKAIGFGGDTEGDAK